MIVHYQTDTYRIYVVLCTEVCQMLQCDWSICVTCVCIIRSSIIAYIVKVQSTVIIDEVCIVGYTIYCMMHVHSPQGDEITIRVGL